MTSLTERIEAATADQQEELLYEAWAHLAVTSPAFKAFALADDNARNFNRLLDAAGFVDAALMLVPDDETMSLTRHGGMWVAEVCIGEQHYMAVKDQAGLALCAAALRARGVE